MGVTRTLGLFRPRGPLAAPATDLYTPLALEGGKGTFRVVTLAEVSAPAADFLHVQVDVRLMGLAHRLLDSYRARRGSQT
jgi:hypothetical protein